MSVESIARGKLIHVFRSSKHGAEETRHSVQMLSKPSTGADDERFELTSMKLPRGTNYQAYIDKIGHELAVVVHPWSTDTGSGFYIKNVRDITDLGLPKKAA